ncbi:MAG: hypothetical protein RLY43_1418 [Bacteroidota bacterium]|jgi:hypothetical protein
MIIFFDIFFKLVAILLFLNAWRQSDLNLHAIKNKSLVPSDGVWDLLVVIGSIAIGLFFWNFKVTI